MGTPSEPKPVCFFVGAIVSVGLTPEAVVPALVRRLGPVLAVSAPLEFDRYTGYYRDEMGTGLARRFFAFGRPGRPDGLAGLKLFTNGLETKFSRRGRRRVNLDPGWLDPARVVLATTKDFSHRLYLDAGIYGEVTMLLHDEAIEYLPWTYPDYRSREARDFFLALRALVFPGHRPARKRAAGRPAGKDAER